MEIASRRYTVFDRSARGKILSFRQKGRPGRLAKMNRHGLTQTDIPIMYYSEFLYCEDRNIGLIKPFMFCYISSMKMGVDIGWLLYTEFMVQSFRNINRTLIDLIKLQKTLFKRCYLFSSVHSQQYFFLFFFIQ